jgi:hypothetical protein
MPNFQEVLSNIGDFARQQWSPGDKTGLFDPNIAHGVLNGRESKPGQLMQPEWTGRSNAYSDDDIRGFRPTRAPSKASPLQLRRAYESQLREACALIKSAFNGNSWAKLMFVEAMKGARRINEALGISDFPQLFGDVIDRAVLSNYKETEYTWNMVAKLSTVNDFRQVKRFRVDHGTGFDVDGSGNIIPVAIGQQYPEDKLTDDQYTYSIQKYGKRMPFFWETFVNDDLNALKDTPARFGRAFRRMEEYFVTKLFANNTSFFVAGNSNIVVPITGTPYTATNPALSITALAHAMTIMALQRDPDGMPIDISAVTLVVPPALKVTAMNILNADYFFANDQGGTALGTGTSAFSAQRLNVANWARNIVKLAVNSMLPVVDTTHGQTGWYLFADPNGRPALEFGKLRGHMEPELFMKLPNSVVIGEGAMGPGVGVVPGTTNMNPMEGDFDTDAVNYKGRHVFGGTTIDPLMAVYSNGTGV